MKVTGKEKEVTRKKIIASSRKIFREQGYEKASMKSIAKDVGIGASTLYGYYPSKLDLFISSFVDVIFDYQYNYDRIESELEKGFVKGLVSLIYSASVEAIKRDREIIRAFYIASLSSLSWNEGVKKRRGGDALFYKFISEIIDCYVPTNRSLCPFSRVEFKNTIVIIFESCAIEYLLNSEVTEDMLLANFSKHMRVLCAGKYEKY